MLKSLSFQANPGVGGVLWRSLESLAERPRDGWTGLSLPAVARVEPRSAQARPESGAWRSLPPRLPTLPRCGRLLPAAGRLPARASGRRAARGRRPEIPGIAPVRCV